MRGEREKKKPVGVKPKSQYQSKVCAHYNRPGGGKRRRKGVGGLPQERGQ